MQIELIGIFLAIFAGLFFAIRIIIVRKTMESGNSIDAVAVTVFVNLLIFSFLSFLFYFPELGLTLWSFIAFVGAGLIGSFFGRIVYFEGTKRVGASRTVPITRGNMLVSALLAIFFLGETITSGHLIGMLTLAAGVVIISREIETENKERNFVNRFNLLFPLTAMISFGVWAFLSKIGLSNGTPPSAGLMVNFSATYLAIIVYMVLKGENPLRSFKVKERNSYVLAGIFGSLSFGLLYLAFSVSPVVVVMPFRSLSPLFVLILSYFFIRRLENLTKVLVLGSVLVVLGAIMIRIFM